QNEYPPGPWHSRNCACGARLACVDGFALGPLVPWESPEARRGSRNGSYSPGEPSQRSGRPGPLTDLTRRRRDEGSSRAARNRARRVALARASGLLRQLTLTLMALARESEEPELVAENLQLLFEGSPASASARRPRPWARGV